jgi:disulfide bond formation protein DsbB
MLNAISHRQAALFILVIATATIVGAWIFEYIGFAPCELCLKQRWAYYTAIPLALVIAVAAPAAPRAGRVGLMLLGLVWIASMVFGAYHSGVEWKWWPGPDTCTGTGGMSGGLPDLSAPVVMCDEPALRIFGLSLAGWNALISLVLGAAAFVAVRRQGSSSVSQ